MLVPAGGFDVLAFPAETGEHCALLRQAVCARLGFPGMKLDEACKARPPADADISRAGPEVRVVVVDSGENREIAAEGLRLLAAPGRNTA
jgi:acetate kinase